MFLWIGCKLPAEYEAEIRKLCLQKNESLELDTVAFSLPQHISLKISFSSDRSEEIIAYLEHFFGGFSPFEVKINTIEQMGKILWLTVEENSILQKLHRDLDQVLEEKFQIPQHPFDRCFQFHSTLFLDEDTEKIRQMASTLAGHIFARRLQVDTILLGTSPTGTAGDYTVVKEINL